MYQGKGYHAPLKAIIIDAIFREVYSTKGEEIDNIEDAFKLPDNLKKFLAAKTIKEAGQKSSSIVETNTTCCGS